MFYLFTFYLNKVFVELNPKDSLGLQKVLGPFVALVNNQTIFKGQTRLKLTKNLSSMTGINLLLQLFH